MTELGVKAPTPQGISRLLRKAGFPRSDYGGEDYKKQAVAMLERYAEVIREAGYPALVRRRGQEPPWLTILTIAKDAA